MMMGLHIFMMMGLQRFMVMGFADIYDDGFCRDLCTAYSPNELFTVLKNESANSVIPRLNKINVAEINIKLES